MPSLVDVDDRVAVAAQILSRELVAAGQPALIGAEVDALRDFDRFRAKLHQVEAVIGHVVPEALDLLKAYHAWNTPR